MTKDDNDNKTTEEVEQQLRDKWVGERVRVSKDAGSEYADEVGTVTRLDYMDIAVMEVEMDKVMNLDGVSPSMFEKVDE